MSVSAAWNSAAALAGVATELGAGRAVDQAERQMRQGRELLDVLGRVLGVELEHAREQDCFTVDRYAMTST